MYQNIFSISQLVKVFKNLHFAGVWLVGEPWDPGLMKDPRGLKIFPGSNEGGGGNRSQTHMARMPRKGGGSFLGDLLLLIAFRSA